MTMFECIYAYICVCLCVYCIHVDNRLWPGVAVMPKLMGTGYNIEQVYMLGREEMEEEAGG